jgi:uncharacterized protein YabN with tetrapyrrole methylase and pyrophosphatase domain
MRRDYRGVRDAFAPPHQQPYGERARRPAKTPSPARAPKSPLLEDDADSWAAVPGDGAAKTTAAGSLVIVDTGVVAVNQVTVEGYLRIRQSDRVLFLGVDPVTEHWIRTLNENVESLNALETADEIVERMLDHIRAGLAICLVSHGRAALNAQVQREAIALSRAENFPAAIVPGVSALECLFSDLGLDPLRDGCQIFSAEHFVEHGRRPDPSAALVVSLSEETACTELLQVLRTAYGAEHEVIIHEPARYAVLDPVIRRTAIGSMSEGDLAGVSHLYVPPKDANG